MFSILLNIFLLLVPAFGGRTTTKYYTLPGGGFHHHGGFLGGYFDFYQGSRDNPADSFSDDYQANAADFINYEDREENGPVQFEAELGIYKEQN